ncbi:hypothetical protein EON80_12345, partial [bacterium]
MRLSRWLYVAALVFPLLLIIVVPALRIPTQKLVGGPTPRLTGIYLEFPWTIQNDWDQDKRKSGQTLDEEIWALHNRRYVGRFENFSAKAGSMRVMLAFAKLADENPQNALLLVQALLSAPQSDGRVAGPWEDSWDSAVMTRSFSIPRSTLLSPAPPLAPLPVPEIDEDYENYEGSVDPHITLS